jgi:hypothetical protein
MIILLVVVDEVVIADMLLSTTVSKMNGTYSRMISSMAGFPISGLFALELCGYAVGS